MHRELCGREDTRLFSEHFCDDENNDGAEKAAHGEHCLNHAPLRSVHRNTLGKSEGDITGDLVFFASDDFLRSVEFSLGLCQYMRGDILL